MEKSDALKKLDAYVDELKKTGATIVYCLARYDLGEDKRGVEFHTRISFPDDKVLFDDWLDRALFEHREQLDLYDTNNQQLRAVILAVRDEGWTLWFFRSNPNWKPGARYVASHQLLNEPHVSVGHQRLDMAREILKEWHNMTHQEPLLFRSEFEEQASKT